MKRPKCKRCNGLLDIFYDPEIEIQEWCCNNPKPIYIYTDLGMML